MSTVRRNKTAKEADRLRVAPNTIVGWFEGMKEHTGRVVMNIPGTQWNVGSVIVRDTAGTKRVLRADRVFVKARQD